MFWYGRPEPIRPWAARDSDPSDLIDAALPIRDGVNDAQRVRVARHGTDIRRDEVVHPRPGASPECPAHTGHVGQRSRHHHLGSEGRPGGTGVTVGHADGHRRRRDPSRHRVPTQERAEGVGFEPTRAFALAVFKTAAFSRSATPPKAFSPSPARLQGRCPERRPYRARAPPAGARFHPPAVPARESRQMFGSRRGPSH